MDGLLSHVFWQWAMRQETRDWNKLGNPCLRKVPHVPLYGHAPERAWPRCATVLWLDAGSQSTRWRLPGCVLLFSVKRCPRRSRVRARTANACPACVSTCADYIEANDIDLSTIFEVERDEEERDEERRRTHDLGKCEKPAMRAIDRWHVPAETWKSLRSARY